MIDAPEGEKLMSVTTTASMPHGIATIWARWITHMIAVVWVRPNVVGVATASASWSSGPIRLRPNGGGAAVYRCPDPPELVSMAQRML